MEQVIQDGRHDGRRIHDRFHLIDLPMAFARDILGIVKELAIAALHRERYQRLPDFLILHHFAEGGNRPLLLGEFPQGTQGFPDKVVLGWCDDYVLLSQIGQHPFLGPLDFLLILDIGQRLEGKFPLAFSGNVIEIPTNSQSQCPARCRLIEDEHIAVRVFQEVSFQRIEQHGLAAAGWPTDHRMPYVFDMQRQPEWREPAGIGIEQYRPLQVLIPFVSGPQRGDRG